MRGDRHLALHSQVREERLHLLVPHLRRMAHAVKTDERPTPVHIGLFGAPAVVHAPDALTQSVKQLDRAQGWQRRRLGLHTRARRRNPQ